MQRVAIAPDELARTKEYAARIGGDLRLVQGAGGNFSVKSEGLLWIKASGTRLGQATERSIFVPLRLAAARAAVLETEDLGPFVLAERADPGLRPSIETSLHALLPHTVVLHLHSTGAIAAGIDTRPGALDALPTWFETFLVPYAKPGISLARAVLAQVKDAAGAPLAIVLRNHGLVAAADDLDTASRIVDAVHRAFAVRPAPALSATGRAEGDWIELHPPGTVGEGESRTLRLGPLTPDEAVFLGSTPFTSRKAPDPASSVAVADDGSIWLRAGTGPDEVEIARSIVDVARLLHGDAIAPLTSVQVDELIDWEAERWRRRLKR